MKYQSELIREILEVEGHKSSSLHYESECMEEWIESVSGAYPKLCDYEGEWLKYYLENGGIGEFPYETVTNVTDATIFHTVPIPFKRAILSGRTLVNLLDRNNMEASRLDYTFENGVYTINSNQTWSKMMFTPKLVQNKKYLVMASTSVPNAIIFYRDSSDEATRICAARECPFIFTNPVEDVINVSIEFPSTVTNGTLLPPMIIEYQEGMENWGVSCFEGMQSVKMPVLTTSGKNLFDEKIVNNKEIDGNTGEVIIGGRTIPINFISVEPNTSYTLTRPVAKLNVGIRYYSKSQDYLSSLGFINHDGKFSVTFTTPSDCYFIKFIDEANTLQKGYQIEQGTQATSYEPYQSNILTVNEDVELRGIGDVRDTLDLMTGEVVNNFSIYRFSDTDNWGTNTESNSQRFTLYVSQPPVGGKYSNEVCIITDRLNGVKWNQSWDTVNTITCNDSEIAVHLPLGTTIEQCKEFMRNSIAIYRTTESLKTVDLSITNQEGLPVNQLKAMDETTHIKTNGTPIKPFFTGEISVEAIEQNLNSFIEQEGEQNE